MAIKRRHLTLLTLLALSALAGLIHAESGRSVPGFDVVYPPPQSRLNFSHLRHAGIDCLTCHAGVLTSRTTADRNLPGEESCQSCHAQAVRQFPGEAGSEARCATCHQDYDPSGASRPSQIYWPAARLNFSHQTHVGRMIACTTCHAGITLSERSGQRHLPREGVCLQCHSRQNERGACTRCHPGDPSEGMTTDFGGIRLVPSSGSLNHSNDWLRLHVTQAQLDKKRCDSCHQPRFCNACHDGVLKPLRIHPEDYVTTHSIDARKQTPRCQSCHRFQSFCTDCHTKLGVGPESSRKDPRTRIHPPGWGDCSRGPTHHADQARRNISACVSCHTESDCLRCHRAGAPCGGGVKIHGHLSEAQLRRMKQQNPRACEKCHAR